VSSYCPCRCQYCSEVLDIAVILYIKYTVIKYVQIICILFIYSLLIFICSLYIINILIAYIQIVCSSFIVTVITKIIIV